MNVLMVLFAFLSGTGFGIFVIMVADYIFDNCKNHEEQISEIDDLIKKHNNKFEEEKEDGEDE